MTTHIKSNPAESNAAALQHEAIGIHAPASIEQPPHTAHPEAQWFATAGLGLFIHWGVAAVHGNVDLSWGMMANTPWDQAEQGRNKITPNEYWKLAERFSPEKYDPDRWLGAAAKAGCQYAVLTTMHHDGYTLWPSKYSEFGVHTHPGGRDLVRPFVEAARRHGLKVGLYYSPPDWYFDRNIRSFNYGSDNATRFPDRPFFDQDHRIVTVLPQPAPDDARRRREMLHRRVEELLTRYGRIDLMWFDGGECDESLGQMVRHLQPHIVLNSRTFSGDYGCTECTMPAERFEGWFETCHCWQEPNPLTNANVWGYLNHERYKSTAWMLESLVRLRAWGGNLLVNVGPRGNGELPPVVYDRLAETARWMAHSKPSVIGAEAGPIELRSNVPVTRRASTLYAHLLPGMASEITMEPTIRPAHVRLLRTGQSLDFQWTNGQLRVNVPPPLRTEWVDVVEIENK